MLLHAQREAFQKEQRWVRHTQVLLFMSHCPCSFNAVLITQEPYHCCFCFLAVRSLLMQFFPPLCCYAALLYPFPVQPCCRPPVVMQKTCQAQAETAGSSISPQSHPTLNNRPYKKHFVSAKAPWVANRMAKHHAIALCYAVFTSRFGSAEIAPIPTQISLLPLTPR